MSMLKLDPKPVRFRENSNRNALLGLLREHPDLYVFEPRPGYEQDRALYRSEEIVYTVRKTRIVGADYGDYDD